jgi:hypothetical protein
MTSVQTSFPVTSALKIQAIYNEAWSGHNISESMLQDMTELLIIWW